MKKNVIIGCLFVVCALLLLTLGCGGFLYYKISSNIEKNKLETETVIGNKLPPGYLALYAGKNQKESPYFEWGSVLMKPEKSSVIMVRTGKPYKSEQDKQNIIKKEIDYFKNNRTKDPNVVISPPREEIIGDKKCIKYLFQQKLTLENFLVIFFETPEHSYCIYYTAKGPYFVEQDANSFIELIKS